MREIEWKGFGGCRGCASEEGPRRFRASAQLPGSPDHHYAVRPIPQYNSDEEHIAVCVWST